MRLRTSEMRGRDPLSPQEDGPALPHPKSSPSAQLKSVLSTGECGPVLNCPRGLLSPLEPPRPWRPGHLHFLTEALSPRRPSLCPALGLRYKQAGTTALSSGLTASFQK